MFGNTDSNVRVPPGMQARETNSSQEVQYTPEFIIIMYAPFATFQPVLWRVYEGQINTIEYKSDAAQFINEYERKTGNN